MFLLVSVRHVGAHPGEHQHGVSIQISISLGKTFLRISRIRNIPLTWILARVFVYVPPFISQILDFIYWTVLIFILIYFEWRDTENQQYYGICENLHYESVYFKELLNDQEYYEFADTAAQGLTQHHKASHSFTRHHTASQSITLRHKTKATIQPGNHLLFVN